MKEISKKIAGDSATAAHDVLTAMDAYEPMSLEMKSRSCPKCHGLKAARAELCLSCEEIAKEK